MVSRYDLTGLPDDIDITKAIFKLHRRSRYDSTGADSIFAHLYNADCTMKIHKITKKIDAGNFSWREYKDAYSSEVEAQYDFKRSNHSFWLKFNVTEAVKDFYLNPEINNGLIMISSGASPVEGLYGGNNSLYPSSEYSDITFRPELTITYEKKTAIAGKLTPVSTRHKEVSLIVNGMEFNFLIPDSDIKNFQVYNLKGARLNSGILKNNKAWVDMQKSGIYIIRFVKGANSASFKINITGN